MNKLRCALASFDRGKAMRHPFNLMRFKEYTLTLMFSTCAGGQSKPLADPRGVVVSRGRNWPISETTAAGCGVCLLRVHPPPECARQSAACRRIGSVGAA